MKKLGAKVKPKASIAAKRIPKEAVKFGKSHYLYVDQNVSWPEAVEASKKLGGQLVCIETPEEAKFLFDKFKNKKRAWVGATNETGKQMWVNGKAFDKRIWHKVMWNGGENNVLTMWIERKELNDFKPQAGKFNFIVEWD